MKQREKPVFFIVALFILGLAYTAIFGVYTSYGDRHDTVIRGANEIRLGTDIQGGVDVTFGPRDESISVTAEQMDAVRNIIERRLVLKNITDSEVYSDVNNKQVLARYPWKSGDADKDAVQAVEELGKTAKLTFNEGRETKQEVDSEGNTITVPAGELVLSGNDVETATARMVQDPNTGAVSAIVELKLKDSGRDSFARATTRLAAEKGIISIWLDNEEISWPAVSDPITEGVATISGNFDYPAALELANLITSGALPFDIEVKAVGTLDASLGMKALDIMVLAAMIAFSIITVFMIAYYRLPGFIAVISLIGQIGGSLAAVSGYFGFLNSFTLTLPGIAGIILSIGMGVDANVITAERIKEEIRSGRTIDGAIGRGSKDSFVAIFDGNITNIIVAIVLMGVFGPPSGIWATVLRPVLMWFPASTTGSIYSFGYTLFAGIVFNFIMGVTASRLMLRSITRFKIFRKPWLLGGERS